MVGLCVHRMQASYACFGDTPEPCMVLLTFSKALRGISRREPEHKVNRTIHTSTVVDPNGICNFELHKLKLTCAHSAAALAPWES